MTFDTKVKIGFGIFGGLMFALVISLLTWSIVQQVNDPCAEYEREPCTETVCLLNLEPGNPATPCVAQEERETTCETSRCARWK